MKKKNLLLLATVALLALLMPACIVPAVTPTPSKTISGVGDYVTIAIGDPIVSRTFDVNGDGKDDTIQTRLSACRHYGVLEGYIVWQGTRVTDGATGITRATATFTFWGKVGDSAPGTMTLTNTSSTDPATLPPGATSTVRQVVVEGSGSGGLEGVSGFGVGQGQSAPRPGATVTVPSGWSYGWLNYQFSFGPK